MIFVIEPHKGIGPITFGMDRAEVVIAMAICGGGQPEKRGSETDCFFDNAFQVSFGDNGKADFIEVWSGITADVLFDGRDVFDLHADELLRCIRFREQEDHELSEPGDSYTFSGLILTLWDRDEQYDYKGGEQRPIFATVGVGAPTYLEAIRAIHRKTYPA
jgi:hypothetical protein